MRAAIAEGGAALLVVGGLAGAGAATALQRRRRTAAVTARRAAVAVTAQEWVSRVKRITGGRAVFEVTIPKPLGLIPKDFPNRPGVGVAKINPGGNTDSLNKRVLLEGAPGMWVLEGDEVVAVNGTNVEGKSLEDVGPLVKESKGDSVTLTLCRNYKVGPVKVVFMPGGEMSTMKRGVEIEKAAEVAGNDVAYSCREGWCKACWHSDPLLGKVYKACESTSNPTRPSPPHPRKVPEDWDNTMPFVLVNWAETVKQLRAEKKKSEMAMA